MFKNSDNVFFYREQNEGREMFNGSRKGYETNPNQILNKQKLFLSPQSGLIKQNQRHQSPFLGKLINKQNQQSTGNYLKNPSTINMSPMKLPLTPSRVKNVLQSPRGILKQNAEALQFRNKSPISRQFDFKKVSSLNTNQYETTRNQEHNQQNQQQGFKLLSLKRGSLQYTTETAFQCKNDDDKKHKNELLDDIIKNCGKKQQENLILNSTGMEFRPKSPFIKQNNRVKTISHEQNLIDTHIECYNNHGKQAKYKLIHNQTHSNPNYYCSKCAITLIQQGYSVEQLSSQSQPSKPLNNQALQILQQLTAVSHQLQNKYQTIRQFKNNHLLQYNYDINSIDEYYNGLIKSIEELRSRDKEIILEYQSHSLREVDLVMSRIQETLTEIHAVKIEIQSKPDMISIMRNNLEQHIRMYEQLVSCELAAIQKTVNVVIDASKLGNFKKVLMSEFSLLIEAKQQCYIDMALGMDRSNGVAFSFEGAMLEEIKNDKKPFRNLFSGEQEEEVQVGKYDVYQAQEEIVGDQVVRDVLKDGACSPSFKKI